MTNSIDLGIDYLGDIEPLGSGGFSTVYVATDTRFDRRVAVKVLDTLSDEADKRRFERECRAMGRLSSHPNVVTVFDSAFAADGAPVLIMELVAGGSLDDRLAEGGPMSWQKAVDLVAPIASALGKAHDSNILHRDVKPANILIGDGTAKLTDFGISSFRDSTGATSANIAASWLHTPPETFPNKRDARSDLYSLGSTLYTLVTGHPPLWREGEDSLEPLMYRILHEPVPSLPPGLGPPDLDRFLQWVLAKDPDHRPQSASEFIDALDAIRQGRPVAAPATVRSGPPFAVPPASSVAGPSMGQSARSAPPQLAGNHQGGVAAQKPRSIPWNIVVPVLSLLAVVAMSSFAWSRVSGSGAGLASPSTGSSIETGLSDRGSTTTESSDTASTAADQAGSNAEAENGQASSPTSAETAGLAGLTTTETTAEVTAAPSTTTEQVPSPPELASYQAANVSPLTSGVTEFVDFLADHQNEIVELDIVVTLPSAVDFSDGNMTLYEECGDSVGPGEPPTFLACSGYVLAFLAESAGTSIVGFDRGDQYRIFGYFTVGQIAGPNQGYLSIVIDPVAPADALSGGG